MIMDWSISLAQLITLPVATIGVCKKGHASQLRSQQNERVIPCTGYTAKLKPSSECLQVGEMWVETSGHR